MFAEKLATLKIDGSLEQSGFRVTLELGSENARPDLEVTGFLPADRELLAQLQQWQHHYRQLGNPNRLTAKRAIHGGSVSSVAQCQAEADRLRDRFCAWLESDGFRPIDRCLREELSRNDRVRLLIRTDNPHLCYLPWHLWDFVQRYPHAEVALAATSFRRIPASPRSGNLRILAILGHRDGIDVEADRQMLEALPGADVTFLVEPSRQQITDHLWEATWDILFFAGHSQTEDDQGRLFINPHDSLSLAELTYGLRQAIHPAGEPLRSGQGLQLAIFNSCDGLGLARELEKLHLPQVIVMREPVPDQVAQTFLRYFLKAFSEGQSLYQATRQARERLQGLEAEFPCASGLPILYQTAADPPFTWQASGPSREANPPLLEQANSANSRRSLQWSRWLSCLAVGLASAAIVLGVRQAGGLQRAELAAYDHLMRLRPAPSLQPRVLIVEATEADIKTYGYPLPDAVLAQAVTRLQRHQPRVIGLDIFRDRLTGSQNPLQQAFQQHSQLVGLCSLRDSEDPQRRPGIRPPAGASPEQLGFSNLVLDLDGVLRRHLVFATPTPQEACSTPLSLSAQVTLKYLATEKIEPQNLEHQQVQLGKARLVPLDTNAGAYRNLDHWGFQLMLNYAPDPATFRRIGLTDLLNDRANPGNLQNYAVLIGMVAPSSNPTDDFVTPDSAGKNFYDPIPGVMIHAQMVNQLLAAALDGRPLIQPLPVWGDAVWIVGWSLAGAGTIGLLRRWYRALGLAGCGALLYGTCWGLLVGGWWVPLLPPLLAIGLGSVSILALEQRQPKTGGIIKEL